MPDVRLRLASPGDAAAMVQLQRASWLAAYGAVLGDDLLKPLSEEDHLRIWQGRLAGSAPRPLLICLETLPVGLLYWRQEGSLAWIRAFYLHPDCWRRGLGRRLWQMAAEQMRRAGCHQVCLWLLAGNRIGAGFYFRNGFRPTGERRTLMALGRPCQQHLLAKTL